MLLVDGNHLASRCRYAQIATLETTDGRPSGVIYGVIRGLTYVGAKTRTDPENVIVFWDGGTAQGRKELLPEYKSGRRPKDPTPEQEVEFRSYVHQLNALRDGIRALGIRQAKIKGCEADDLISVAVGFYSNRNNIVIFSGDKDFHQLVTEDGAVDIFDPRQDKVLTEVDVTERWGVPPSLIPIMRAVWGDASDNIKGVPGLGEKRARICARFWDAVEDRIPEMDRKWVNRRRVEHRDIVDRNLALMQLPLAWEDSFYALDAGLSFYNQLRELPLKDRTGFSEFCRDWEINEAVENSRW